MTADIIDFGKAKNIEEEAKISSTYYFPTVDGVATKFCNFVPPIHFPVSPKPNIRMAVVYLPCVKQCQNYDDTLEKETGNPCRARGLK